MNIHNTMTKCAALLLGGAAIFASCTDLSGIEERIDSLDSRVTALENQVASFNESLTAINGLLEDGTVITSITETENGYTFSASNGETYTITNGTAGNTPLVRIDAEGNWEVSYDDGDSYDDIMVDENTPASAQGIAPQFQVSEDGYWQVSTDGGKTFSDVHYAGTEDKVPAVGESGTSWFKDVEYDEENGTLTITLANSDTPLVIPVVSDFSCIIYDGQNPVDYETVQVFSAGDTKDYTVKTTGVVSAKLTAPQGWKASLSDINETGEATLTVTAPASAPAAALTKVTADTGKDITIHALNKDGLSLFAKMQVETVSGPVPTMKVEAGTIEFTSVSFSISDVENLTGYRYLLYASTTAAPDQSALLSSGTLVEESNPTVLDGLTHTSDGTAITYNTAYTLYLLPINDNEGNPIYGNIISVSVTTLTPETYYDLFMAGGNITIGESTYKRSDFSDENIVHVTEGEISATNGNIYFIDGGCTIGNVANQNVILVGNDMENKPVWTIMASKYLSAVSGEKSRLILYNITIDASNFTNYIFTVNTNYAEQGAFGELVFDNCDIHMTKSSPFYSISGARYLDKFIMVNCNVNVPDNASNRFMIHTNTNETVFKQIIYRNNIFYCPQNLATGFRLVSSGTNGDNATTVEEICVENNTFINAVPSNSAMIIAETVQSATLNRNIFYTDQTQSNNRNMIRCNVAETGSYPSSANATANYAFDNNGAVYNIFYSSNYSPATGTVEPVNIIDASPFTSLDITTGTYTLSGEYSSYGAQR